MQNVAGPILVATATKFGLKSPITRLVRQIGRRCFDLLWDFRGWRIQINATMQNFVGPTLVAMATTFALGTESKRLPACLTIPVSVTSWEHRRHNILVIAPMASAPMTLNAFLHGVFRTVARPVVTAGK